MQGWWLSPKAITRYACVDLTKLNKSACRERHILPSVEQTLAQWTGTKTFTKLDANSGFCLFGKLSYLKSLP